MRFVCEYAKSGQASCKFLKCKQKIGKGLLRVGKVSPSPFSEGSELTQWFHANCLFEQMKNPRASKLGSSDELDGFADLQDEDKQLIGELIAKLDEAPAASETPKRKKKTTASAGDGSAEDGSADETATGKAKKSKKNEGKKPVSSSRRQKKKKAVPEDEDD